MTIRYTEEHEWVDLQDNLYVVGITDYAQEQLGEVVYVDLPAPGDEVAAGAAAAVVESVKAAGEIKSPLGGTVAEVNPRLEDAPQLVNEQPEGDGWLYKLQVSDTAPLQNMMDADAYHKWVATLG